VLLLQKKLRIEMKFFLLCIFLVSYLEAIITIKPVVIGAKPGTSGTVEGSFQTKRGNTEKDEYTLGIKAQYDNNRSYVTFIDLIGVYGEASGVRNTNKTYLHTRFIHKFIANLNYELFFQSETNEFTSVEKRRVVGGGFRYHFLDKKLGDLFFGLGAYYETISYTTTIDPFEKNVRINSYVAYTTEFTKTASFTYVGYYQPKIDFFNDYILSNAVALKIDIYEHLNLNFKLYYDVDSKPAIGREKMDFTQVTSFSYDF
jgi:putative salt-induced outer membrane protein YdiY